MLAVPQWCICMVLLAATAAVPCFADTTNQTQVTEDVPSLSTYCEVGFGEQFDEESQTCVISHGQYCGTRTRSRPPSQWAYDPNKFRCGQNAICSYRSRCECSEKFVPTADMINCVKGQEYGEICDLNRRNCQINYICSEDEKKCKCWGDSIWNSTTSLCYSDSYCERRAERTFYDSETATCLCWIGQRCQINLSETPTCPRNSSPREMEPGSTHNYTICACNEGFIAPYGKYCLALKRFREACSNSTDICERPSTCLDGICQCPGGYREEENGCRIRAYSSGCGVGDSQCTLNSYCSINSCWCYSGYVRSESGGCGASFGTSCTVDAGCVGNLVCMDGVCACRNPLYQINPDDGNSCRNLAGAKCNTNGTTSCVANSYCDPSSGTCQCVSGFLPNPKRLCTPVPTKHGESCNPSDCDIKKGMACVNQTCTCFDTSLTFHGDGVGCLAPLGSTCGRYPGPCKDPRPECPYYVPCEKGLVCKRDEHEHGEYICEPGNELSVAPSWNTGNKPLVGGIDNGSGLAAGDSEEKKKHF